MEVEDHAVIEEGKIWAALAYLAWPIPFFAARDNAFVDFHLRQALPVVACAFVIALAYAFLAQWTIVRWTLTLAEVVVFGLGLLGVVNALRGARKALPLTAKLAERVPF